MAPYQAPKYQNPDDPGSGFGGGPSIAPAPTPVPGSGGGGGGEGQTTTDPLAIDWKAWLEDWGFDPEIVKTIDQMARRYSPAQGDLFARDAIAYIRSTDWYARTFPGINEAFKSGVVTNERDYRRYVLAANDVYRRYHGRDITTEELVRGFVSGFTPERLGGELAAGSWVNANRGDVQYLLGAFAGGRVGEEDLLNLGREQQGIGNQMGSELMRRVQLAQQRLGRIFQGTLATPERITSLAPGNIAPDVGK